MFFTRNRGWRKGSVMEISELWSLEARWSKRWKLMRRQVGIYGRYGGIWHTWQMRYGTCGQIFNVILSRGELEIISSSQLSFPHSRLPLCSAICSYHALGGFSILTPFLANNKKIQVGGDSLSRQGGCPGERRVTHFLVFQVRYFFLHRKLSQKVSKQWLPQ